MRACGRTVFVSALGVDCVHDQSDGFPFHGVAGKLFSFFAETGDRLFRMDSFRRVDADQANFFVRADDDCVAIDDPDHLSKFALQRAGGFRLR